MTNSLSLQEKVVTKADMNKYIKAITKSVEQMKSSIDKSLKEEKETLSDDRINAISENNEILVKLQAELANYKSEYKQTIDRKKKISNGNLGLSGPHFAVQSMINFINTHAKLPAHIRIQVNPNGYGVFDRSTMTKFWSFYVKQNNLKDQNKKGMYITDKELNKLFGSVIHDPQVPAHEGKTYYQVMVDEILEMRKQPDHKPSNTNRAQFEPADSDGTEIKAINNAAFQVLVKPFFRNGYSPSNKEEYVSKLKKVNEFFDEPNKAV